MKPIKTPIIKTIGHSNHPIERFVELLTAGGVERLVDVRSVPGSRRLAERGAAIEHLLADGAVRPHAEVEEALLKKAGDDLFENRDTRLARAYRAREKAMKR